jgi:beta-N-acetylhexosaminidase
LNNFRLNQFSFSLFLTSFLVFISISSPIQASDISLRDKIGQMLMLGFSEHQVTDASPVVQWIDQHNIGGVIAFDYDETGKNLGKNILSEKQIHNLTNRLQSYTKKYAKKHHRPLVPLLISIDYEGGWVDRLKTADGFEPTLPPAVFPKLSATKLKHELYKMSHYMKIAVFNLDLAPIVDVEVNPTNPIIAAYKRSYSPDPMVVTHFAQLYIKALRAQGVQCALKHFPGHGSSQADSHLGLVDISKHWKSYELLPYQLLITEKPTCGVVMTAHLVNRQLDPSGLPATLSKKMLTDLLRHHLHFQGVIMSDDMQMKAIENQYSLKQSITLAINAGVDILLFANQTDHPISDPKILIDLIEEQVKTGAISPERINDAYDHILNLKKDLPN